MIFKKKKDPSEQNILLHHLFEQRVNASPDDVALFSNDWKLTFQTLENRANRLARWLQRQGVGPDVPVGVSIDRAAPEAIISVLAILKAGGACLPLDPEYPAKRLRLMLEDSRAALLLADEGSMTLFADQPVKRVNISDAVSAAETEVDTPLECAATDENLAYVIYTSGSTGQPKGVAMHHRPLVNLIRWQNKQSKLPPQARTVQFTPLSFDVSFQEIFATLCSGGTLALISDDERLDPVRLVEFINRHGIERLFLPFAALQYIAETADSQNLLPSTLREVITAGEQLQVNRCIRKLFRNLPACTLANHYGPTEAHVVTQYILEGEPGGWPDLPAIGTPIDNTQIHILDEQLQPVPNGEKGEIYIAGIAVARGYLHQPELTAEKFVPDPFSGEPDARMYRTGDLGRRMPDGNIEFIGRADNQVKIRGYRIELGEVETVLGGMPSVKQAIAVPWEQQPGSWSLAAYIQPRAGEVPTIGKMRDWLAERLPDYMVPSAFILVDEFPMTPSGKIDRRTLPQPGGERPPLDTEYAAPASEWEKKITALWQEILGIDRVGIHDSFFELGGTSLLLLRFIARLRQEHGTEVPVARMFRQGTAADLAAFLESGSDGTSAVAKMHERAARGVKAEKAVAIIGMAGRFPGADDVDTFWQNLCDGVDSVTFFDDDELDASVDPALRANPDYVKARGIIADADKFDAAFFGFTPHEAELMDPQQRVMLETGWHALENAGYDSSSYNGIVGVFAGMGNSTYYHENVLTRPDRIEAIGEFQAMVGNEKDYIATRLAYKLNLTGPGVSVHSACSTSLTAVCQAFQSLESGQCDMALAGGVSITTPQNSGYLYQEGGMFSPDGRCRPFDAKAQGTTFNNGAAVVVLKRLEDAQADGDRIYAVIRGVGLNNDGADKMSFTAPSVNGQAGAIAMAQADAGIEPDSISYVETHGTATPVGDPIEVAALTQAFRAGTERTQFCAIGSVKSNVGHLIAAAGVAGLIKTALSLHHRKIPATLYFEKPNPQLELENTPFYVNARLTEWPGGETPRRAGVSAFGVGGTNAHVILEEAPEVPMIGKTVRPRQLLLLSAKTDAALDAATENLAGYFKNHPETDCADAACTLQTGRRGFTYRRCAVCCSAEDAVEVLEKRPPAKTAMRQWSGSRPPLVFMFPGQGAQYVNMGRNLYDTEPLFRETVDECAGILAPLLDRGLLDLLYPTADKTEESRELLKQTHYTQPAIFTIEFAMARLLQRWGFEPGAMVGHSIGEFAAACMAGVMTLEDALKLVAVRGQMMQELPGGSMLSVRAPLADIQDHLPENVTPAALNAPGLCVLSGPTNAVDAVAKQLKEDGITCKPLRTSHAFHSAMMDPMIEPFAEVVGKVELSAPKIPFVSTVTADWITDEQATDPMYWVNQIRQPVRFADSVACLWDQPERVLLEIGPGTSCATLAKNSRRQDISTRDQIAIATMGSTAEDHTEWTTLLMAVGQLWLAGAECDWGRFQALENCRRIPLPGYPFERKRYWLLPGGRAAVDAGDFADEEEETDDLTDLSPRERVVAKIGQVLEDTSGEDLSAISEDLSFMALGFDSLFLTQASLAISREFGVKITFRQLMEEFTTIGQLAKHLESEMPEEQPDTKKPAAPKISAEPFAPEPEKKKTFGAGTRIAVSDSGELTAKQKKGLTQFIEQYTERTQKSKSTTQTNRPQLADPRVVSGFRPLIKELVYPIIVEESSGVTLRDIDGNEYVDLTCGFGSNFFGFSAPFIVKAVEEQLHRGYEIGPQHPLAGEVAGLVSEFTELERVAFCNTGSEAVLGAMRLARTVTGRDTVVMFTGDYHGILDEVIVRGTSSLRSLPAAPGIPRAAVENVLVLDYGTDESLRILRERGNEFAAIMVEPVQSRRPDWQPREFLQACRRIADECGAAFIMDEVITGFRVHPRGAQAVFDVKADIATYGKVVGGGMPIGVIAGSSRFMDALDGGQWQFGDESFPQVGVTYFAGTFVRHPLALAAAKASLDYLKEQGPQLQETLNRRTDELVATVNAFCEEAGTSLRLKNFGSLFKIKFAEDEPFGDLFHAWMRHKGVHVWDARPCFLTMAHTDEDVEFIIRCFRETVTEMLDAELLRVDSTQFETVDGRLMVPTTEAQKEIWTALLMDPDASKAYNESVNLRLAGKLDREALSDAIIRTVARHDALRGTFSPDGMYLRISPSIEFAVQFEDLTGESEEARATRVKEIQGREADDPFDIENGPLLRAKLLALTEQEHLLVLTGHHLVCDGWSIDVIVHDIGRIYTALSTGKEPGLEPAFSIAEYARLELEWNAGDEFKAANDFWLGQFEGELPVLELPLDHDRPPMRTTNGTRVDAPMSQDLVDKLKKISAEQGCTFVNILMAAFKVYIHQISGQEDITVGLPTSGQAARGMESLVGHCVNFLPIRSRVEDRMAFSVYMKQLRSIMLDAFEHQLYTFGTLLRNLKVARDPSRVPLAPVVFNVDNGIDLEKIRFADLKSEFTSNPKNYETFELFLNAVDDHGHFYTEWAYNTDLFNAKTIQRHISGYENLLKQIAEKPDVLIGALDGAVV